MSIHNFDLKLSTTRDGKAILSVLASCSGEVQEAVPLFMDHEIFSARVGSLLGGPTSAGDASRNPEEASQQARRRASRLENLRTYGDFLLRALFPPKVRSRWDESRGRAEKAGETLRLRLRIAALDEHSAPYHNYPWEYLYDRETGRFLALQGSVSIVRYLEIPCPPRQTPKIGPLRILCVSAQPDVNTSSADPPLRLRDERELLEVVAKNSPDFELQVLEHATPETLQAALSVQGFHVLHFMGHGIYDGYTGWGGLLLEDGRGGPRYLWDNALGTLLDIPAPPSLVVLNACKTARGNPPRHALEPFAGAAAGLVAAGVPAVIAMQTAISAHLIHQCLGSGWWSAVFRVATTLR